MADFDSPAASPAPSASEPAPAAPSPAPAPAPAESPPAAPAPAPAPAEDSGPKTSLEAAVLGLEATGLKLDQPLPADQVVRLGAAKEGEPATGADTAGAGSPAAPSQLPTDPVAAEPGAGADDKELPDPTADELAAAPSPLRRRFQQVREQNVRLKELVARVQPSAQQFDQLQSFMSTHELDARSAANALRVAALVQGAINGRVDPSSALSEVMQVADSLRVLVGDSLPPDLQQRLSEGVIDDVTAKEIARLRAIAVTRARRAELDTAASSQQASQATAGLVHSAVSAWEASVRARDPDYARKAKLVETTARSMRMEQYGNGSPPTPEQGVALAQAAYDLVSQELKAALPPAASVRAPLSGATPSKSTVRAEPKTSLEAAIQGLERMGT